jgi:aryl-alcohol dehydrogenase-like predicted oxidoreductase
MTFREPVILGRTGLKVSRLGLASGYGVPAHAVEKAFHEYSINYFYWASPRRSGMKKALRNLAADHRDNMVVVFQSYDHLGLVMSHFHDNGLLALGLEYADVLLLGWFNHYPSPRVLEAAVKLKEQGKVRFLALSGHRRANFRELLQRADSPIDIFMIRYNAANRGAESEVFPYLPKERRPGITTYTATRWSQLLKARKMPQGEKPLTASECYRFVLSNPAVDLCMTGPADAQQMEEGFKALDACPLSEEEMARIRRIGDYVHG